VAQGGDQWTITTLKEHFEALRAADLRAVQTALETVERAISKADTATDKRFDGVNEFRKALGDQTAELLPRREYSAQHQTLVDAIADFSKRLDRAEGKREGLGSTGQLIFQLTIAAGVVASILFSVFGHK
jgi:hypothetical protein